MEASAIIVTIITTVIGSGAFFTFLQFLVNRHDSKKSNMVEIRKDIAGIRTNVNSIQTKLDDITMHEAQTHLAVLISDFPKKHAKIFKLAERYFNEGGDDWITDLFEDWLISENEPEPDWFTRHKKEHK